MTDKESYRCESHDKKIEELEKRAHIQEERVNRQDKATALLSIEIKNLSENVEKQNKNTEKLASAIASVEKIIADILPQIKVSRQWEDIYRSGISFLSGAIIVAIISLIFSYFKR